MLDSFTITIIFIVLTTLIAAFVRRTSRDKCLQGFDGFFVTLETAQKESLKGELRLANTGLEILFLNNTEKLEKSYLLYKAEFPNINVLIRYHEELTDKNKKKREKELKKTYRPGPLRRLIRKIKNVFRTVRDSIIEVINLLISQVKKTPGISEALPSNDKYVHQMRDQLMDSVNSSYEPLLERYIGQKVMIDFLIGEEKKKIIGVLKEYTSEFIALMDVDYQGKEQRSQKADLVLLRTKGIVRHFVGG